MAQQTKACEMLELFTFQYGATNIGLSAFDFWSMTLFTFQYGATNIFS